MNTIKRSTKIKTLDTFTHGTIFSERPKRSNHFKVISPEYKEYSIFDVVAHFSDKPIDQILEEQKKVRDSWR